MSVNKSDDIIQWQLHSEFCFQRQRHFNDSHC